MKFGIIQFPGSNCDDDCLHVVRTILGEKACKIWHESDDLKKVDCVVLPGGFSYGDYLRCGAMAGKSPIMKSIREFGGGGGLVLGICNGFQILCEAGLLPGILVRNKSLKFICEPERLKIERNVSPFTNQFKVGEEVQMPIAHMEGHYYIDEEGLAKLRANHQIILRYQQNPNGAVDNIAGICNENGNVFGLMPHPERVCESELGGVDGLKLFQSIISSLRQGESQVRDRG